MAVCTFCKTQANLVADGVPICVQCSESRAIKHKPSLTPQEVRTVLLQDLVSATARNREVIRRFDESIGKFPSGLPHPDGVQRIKNASNALNVARKEMGTAHSRLNDYISRGIVPDDLKQIVG
jgi:hypothetical protein